MTVARAFTKEQAARLAHASERQVTYWANTGLAEPSILHDRSGRTHIYLYNFEDVVGLRTLSILRNKHGLSLQSLRRVAVYLRQYVGRPWSELRFWVRGKNLYFTDPDTGAMVSADKRRQTTFRIEIEEIAQQVTTEAQEVVSRDPRNVGQIDRQRGVQRNQPVFKGTRILVDSVTNLLDAGYSTNAILDAFPSLDEDDVTVADLKRTQRTVA